MSRYIVKVSAARMPASCWGRYRYRHVAVLEVEGVETVAMISERARGVRRIVQYWGRVYVGSTDECAFGRAYAEAAALAAQLNEEAS